jgi:hypothetical protein
MDHYYLSYYDRSSNPWTSQAKNEPGPGKEAGRMFELEPLIS